MTAIPAKQGKWVSAPWVLGCNTLHLFYFLRTPRKRAALKKFAREIRNVKAKRLNLKWALKHIKKEEKRGWRWVYSERNGIYQVSDALRCT
jgi:hypothetical protein